MSDRATVALAVAAVVGAVLEWGPSPWIAGGLVAVAFAIRQPVALIIGVFLCAGGLAVRAEAGLVSPPPGPFDGWVTLLSDPEAGRYDVHADVRDADGRHLQAVASTATARTALLGAGAGERAHLVGTLERPPPGASWLTARHVVGLLEIDELVARSPGRPWMQAANALRGVLTRGASALPTRQRSLFLGFVLGDTRGQPVDITDDFRGSGLSHLLAVSGQNVAFVLALAGPLLRRLGLRVRLPATLAVIGFFALLTRFEPSVLRASVMAALAVTAATIGRDASSVRLLALAVTGLVLVDPFLVRSVGFQLSVGACIGIVLLSAPIARAVPGPRAVVETLAVSLSAQAGVAPVLISVFGGVPLAGLPANVLAAPAEAPVMVWGLGAGAAAGVFGGRAAVVLHWPTRLLIAWIAWVAHRAALLPLGEVHGRELVVITLGALVATGAHRVGMTGVRRASVAAVIVGALAPALALRAPAPVRVELTAGASLWRADGIVLDLDGRVDATRLLEALRRTGVARLDVLVERTASSTLADAVAALRQRYRIDRVFSPATIRAPTSLAIGRLRIDVRPIAQRLTVEISLAPAGSARGPPASGTRTPRRPRPTIGHRGEFDGVVDYTVGVPGRILVIGGGVGGLGAAYACAGAGLEVTILEQDPLEVPESVDAAFDVWTRPGVPQFRHSHAFLPRLVMLLRSRAPSLLEALLASGATQLSLADRRPAEMMDFEPEPSDVELTALGCRRSTFEWVLRRAVKSCQNVSIERARAVGLVVESTKDGRTIVRGVHTADPLAPTEIAHPADLVIDASGTRSALPSWLEHAGLAPPDERSSPTGIVYATRFYRSRSGVPWPSLHAPIGDDLEYLTYAVYPGDNGTFSVTIVVPVADAALRTLLRDDHAFDAAARVLPHTRPWVDRDRSEPITPVRVMASLSNRVRTMPGHACLDGLVTLGDAGVVTNPVYGAGCTLALVQAFALADLLQGGTDVAGVAQAFAAFKATSIEPWHHDAVERDRVAESGPGSAQVRDFLHRGVLRAGRTDPAVWRAALRVANLLDPPETMQRPEILRRVLTAWAENPERGAAPGTPARNELLSVVSARHE